MINDLLPSWASNKSLWDVHLESESEMCLLLSKWTGWYLVHTHSWRGLWTAEVGISPNCKWSLKSKECSNTTAVKKCWKILHFECFCHVAMSRQHGGSVVSCLRTWKLLYQTKPKNTFHSRNDTVCNSYLLIVIFPKMMLSFFRVDRGEDTFTITFWLIFVKF